VGVITPGRLANVSGTGTINTALAAAGYDYRGVPLGRGELKTPNHSAFLIKCVSSSPFVTEPPGIAPGR
jgi:hypothetical protein